jgi:hypothetical protein
MEKRFFLSPIRHWDYGHAGNGLSFKDAAAGSRKQEAVKCILKKKGYHRCHCRHCSAVVPQWFNNCLKFNFIQIGSKSCH